VVATPGRTPNGLGDVSCTSRTFCVAASRMDGPGEAVLERWTGARWSILRTWSSASTLSVSCTSRRFCVAVVAEQAMQWNGKRWLAMKFAKPARSVLGNVSCVSPKFCEAVAPTMGCASCSPPNPWGYAWNGHSWSAQPNFNPDYSDRPTSVWCTLAKACMATGSASTGGDDSPYGFVATLNGVAWALQKTPRFEGDSLNGVSCAAKAWCTAVGAQNGPFGDLPPTPLAESWHGGNWSVEPTPMIPPAASGTAGAFTAIACPTRTVCTAVGYRYLALGPTSPAAASQNDVLIETSG
jgi:hypothetical protein